MSNDRIKAWNQALIDLFNEEHEHAMERMERKAKLERKKQEAINWLVNHGVDAALLNRLLEKGKLEIATIEEAKRQYLRLIELCDCWDNADLELLLDNIDEQFVKTRKIVEFEKYLRKILRRNFNIFEEQELIEIVEKRFGKSFNFSWTRGYTRKDGTTVDTYVRIMFKQKI